MASGSPITGGIRGNDKISRTGKKSAQVGLSLSSPRLKEPELMAAAIPIPLMVSSTAVEIRFPKEYPFRIGPRSRSPKATRGLGLTSRAVPRIRPIPAVRKSSRIRLPLLRCFSSCCRLSFRNPEHRLADFVVVEGLPC